MSFGTQNTAEHLFNTHARPHKTLCQNVVIKEEIPERALYWWHGMVFDLLYSPLPRSSSSLDSLLRMAVISLKTCGRKHKYASSAAAGKRNPDQTGGAVAAEVKR